jgi:hypothetical protein
MADKQQVIHVLLGSKRNVFTSLVYPRKSINTPSTDALSIDAAQQLDNNLFRRNVRRQIISASKKLLHINLSR